ncbi:MAG: class I SAM-dependent methyltransferase, partial [Chlorobium sp.]|nr:class I SAM-dependent methyltransferase [Chlorobium sp.]
MEEFDQYAGKYQEMLEDSMVSLGGFSLYYLQQKVKVVQATLASQEIRSILDFGCGLGLTTLMIQEAFPSVRVVGVDISESSIKRAQQKKSTVEFRCISDEKFMRESVNKFDVVYIANVFHHIKVEERSRTIEFLKSMLTPDGVLFFFEHNPYNPITRLVVSRCEFDRNATLISPKEFRLLLREGGCQVTNTRYLLFFP